MAPSIIGLNGKKGAGKDTAGDYFVSEYGYVRVSFAEPLKASAAAVFGVDPKEWEWAKNDPQAQVTLWLPGKRIPGSSLFGENPRKITLAVREYLQRYGTEAHRDIFGADFWTKQLLDLIEDADVHENNRGRYVITDARFVNECAATREAGGHIIRIDRPGTDATDAHASEEDLPEALVDTIILNDGTIEDLYAAVDEFMVVVSA